MPNEQEIPKEESSIDSLFEDSIMGERDIAISDEQEIPEEEFDIDLQYEEATWIDLIKEVLNVL